MYIIKNRIYLTLTILSLMLSCTSTKSISNTNLIGVYENRQQNMLLELKEDSSFWMHNKKEKKGCVGKWSFKENIIFLNCEPPLDVTFLIQDFDYIQDMTFTCKVGKSRIQFYNLVLKRK